MRFQRAVIVVDSGYGKTTNLARLQRDLCHGDGPGREPLLLVARLDAADLPTYEKFQADETPLWQALLGSLFKVYPELKEREFVRRDDQGQAAIQWLREQRRDGRLVLLIDALDQADHAGQLETLAAILQAASPANGQASEWRKCRIVITGRPFIIQREPFRKLLADPAADWRIIELDPFTDESQRRLVLGKLPDGRWRWDALPIGTREQLAPLLQTPRVLDYLRKIPDAEWSQLHTASDVFYQALWHMVADGLKAADAKEFGSGPTADGTQVGEALQFLAAMAFEMIAWRVGDGQTLRHRVPQGDDPNEYDEFRQRLFQRLRPSFDWSNKKAFQQDWDCLQAINVVAEFRLMQGPFDINRVQFYDATIKEFLAALWIAKYGTPEDAQEIESWIHFVYPSKERYMNPNPLFVWFWRYLCEMPAGARSSESWLSAITPLYRPSPFGRSCEMMYRAWPTLNALKSTGVAKAANIVSDFLGEFPAILNGKDVKRARIAAELVPEHVLVKLVKDNQRLQAIRPPADAPAFVRCPPLDIEEKEIQRCGGVIPEQGFQCHHFWRGTALETRTRDGNDVFRWSREDPRHRVRLTPFWLKATHVTQGEFALFDPSPKVGIIFGMGQFAPEPTCPVFGVSWYQSWCLATWCGMALPTESQFEFGVRAGHDGPNDLFPFSPWDTASSFQINCNGSIPFAGSDKGPDLGRPVSVRDNRPQNDRTQNLIKTKYTPNEWGVWHPVGQAWVWCLDWFNADEYERCVQSGNTTDPTGPETGTSRVLRGGAWLLHPTFCRSAVRTRNMPDIPDSVAGLRLVCVVCVRTP